MSPRRHATPSPQVFESINACDISTRPDLYKHIVLSGGSTMYPGLPSRLEKEIKQLYLTNIAKGDTAQAAKLKLRIEDPPRRKHMVFLGGSVLADIMKDKEVRARVRVCACARLRVCAFAFVRVCARTPPHSERVVARAQADGGRFRVPLALSRPPSFRSFPSSAPGDQSPPIATRPLRWRSPPDH